jgi:hypothetical protein
VAIAPATLAVDEAETAALRARMKAENPGRTTKTILVPEMFDGRVR